MRILIDIHRSSNYWEKAWDDPNIAIDHALEALKRKRLIITETQDIKSDIRLIITKISRRDTRIVFDIFHDTFDAARAHLYGQDLPVLIVSMRRGEGNKAFAANVPQARKVNFEIRYLHNHNGMGSQPPFREDSREGIPWSILRKDFRDYEEHHAQRQAQIAASKSTLPTKSVTDSD